MAGLVPRPATSRKSSAASNVGLDIVFRAGRAEAGGKPQRYVEDPLSEELIRGHLRDGEVEVYLEGGQIAYRPAGELTGGRQLV